MKRILGFHLIKIFALILVLMLSGFILTGESAAQKKDKDQPRINIDVKREYDDHGNIIRYDSSYSYSWSGNADDMDTDSLLKEFHHHREIYSFNNGDFFPHDFMFPWYPDFNPGSFFGPEDSTLGWNYSTDTTLRNEFFDNLERSIREMRKYFENNYGPSPFFDDDFLYQDLRNKNHKRQKKNTNDTET